MDITEESEKYPNGSQRSQSVLWFRSELQTTHKSRYIQIALSFVG